MYPRILYNPDPVHRRIFHISNIREYRGAAVALEAPVGSAPPARLVSVYRERRAVLAGLEYNHCYLSHADSPSTWMPNK